MKHKLIGMVLVFFVGIIVVGLVLTYIKEPKDDGGAAADQLIALNEIEQLAKQAASEGDLAQLTSLSEKTEELADNIRMRQAALSGNDTSSIWITSGICIVFILIISAYMYRAIIHPFDKMKQYAGQIARGDFELSLDYERSNYFGEFTWAFDQMRREIKKSRICEREAIENNKTVIATLSHDIRTPIASIRAYTEGLEANLDSGPEKRAQYLRVIMKKCDEVAKYTNDLFLHSLADLDKLKINPARVDICRLLRETLEDMEAGQDDIRARIPERTIYVQADADRFAQLIENVIHNARKYAKSEILITAEMKTDEIEIRIRDTGPGIPDEDLPFIFDKFYRGHNCGNEQGSGLGLYIVKYITEQIKGTITLVNQTDGLEAVLVLPVMM